MEKKIFVPFRQSYDASIDPSQSRLQAVRAKGLSWDSVRGGLALQTLFRPASFDPTVFGEGLVRTFAFGEDGLLAFTRGTSDTWPGPTKARMLVDDSVADGLWTIPLRLSGVEDVASFERITQIDCGGAEGLVGQVSAVLSRDGTELAVAYTSQDAGGTLRAVCRVYRTSDGAMLASAGSETSSIAPVPTQCSVGWRFWMLNAARTALTVRLWTRSTNTFGGISSVFTGLANLWLDAQTINAGADALVVFCQQGQTFQVNRFNGTSISAAAASTITIAGSTLQQCKLAFRDAGDQGVVVIRDTTAGAMLTEFTTLGSNTRTNRQTNIGVTGATCAADPVNDSVVVVPVATGSVPTQGSSIFSAVGQVGPTCDFTKGPAVLGAAAVLNTRPFIAYSDENRDGRKGSAMTILRGDATYPVPEGTVAGLELQNTFQMNGVNQASRASASADGMLVAMPCAVGARPGAASVRVYVCRRNTGAVTSAQVGPYLCIGGGSVTLFDGRQLLDAGGFHGRPGYTATGANTASGALAEGSYFISVSASLVDNYGRVHEGAPALVQLVLLFGGSDTIQMDVSGVFSRASAASTVPASAVPVLTGWRTIQAQTDATEYLELAQSSNGAVPWRALEGVRATTTFGSSSAFLSMISNDDTVQGIGSVAAGQSADVAPWFGSPELGAPQPAQHVVCTGSHVVTYGLPNPRQFQTSMPLDPGLPPRWVGPGAVEYGLFLTELPEPVTAMWVEGGLLFAASRSSVWCFEGSGPDDRGRGGWGPPRKVADWEGVRDPHALAVCPRGTVAVSGTGRIGLITRQGWSWIGDAIEDVLTGAQVASAAYDAERRQVVLGSAAGTNIGLLWHTDSGSWSQVSASGLDADYLGYSPTYGLFRADSSLFWYGEPLPVAGSSSAEVELLDALGVAGGWGAMKQVELRSRINLHADETLTVTAALMDAAGGVITVLGTRTATQATVGAAGALHAMRWALPAPQRNEARIRFSCTVNSTAGFLRDIRLLGVELLLEQDDGAAGRRQTKASYTG